MNKYFLGLLLISFFSCTAQRSISQQSTSSLVNDVVKETNKFRKSNGLTALIVRDELNKLAHNTVHIWQAAG